MDDYKAGLIDAEQLQQELNAVKEDEYRSRESIAAEYRNATGEARSV